MKLQYHKKIENTRKLRQDFKKKRFILDENKENFGLDTLKQLTDVKNKSEIKGYPFKAFFNDFSKTHNVKLGLKVIPIESKYIKHEHPANLEYMILKEFTDNLVLQNITPHIVNYIGFKKIYNKSKAIKFLNLKRLEYENKILNYSNVLLSEYIDGGSLDNWIYETCQDGGKISPVQWKYIVFSLLYTIHILQDKYRFMHNDLHYGNILIDTSIESGGYFVYTLNNNTWYIPNAGIIPKLWDMEFGMVYSNNIKDIYPNRFIIGSARYNYKKCEVNPKDIEEDDSIVNISMKYNQVYDPHYFLTSLLDLYISEELFEWIMNLYPDELIPSESGTGSTTDTGTANTQHTQDTITVSDDTTDTDTYTDTDTRTNSDISSLNSELDKLDLTTTSDEPQYLHDGRLISGVEDLYKELPTPYKLLMSSFFDEFKKIPDDFKKDTALFFEYSSM